MFAIDIETESHYKIKFSFTYDIFRNILFTQKAVRFLFTLLFWILFHCLSLTHFLWGDRPSLEPLTIIATRGEKSILDTAGSDSAITQDDLLRHGSVGLQDALKYEPGVSVPFDFTGADALVPYLGSGEKAINVRGIEGNRISISVDGIRQPQELLTAGGMAGPGRVYFDPATFSQVEIYKSASSSLYGSDAIGGSVNGRTVGPESLLGKDLQGSVVRNSLTFASLNDSLNNRLTAAYGKGPLAHSVAFSVREGSERKNNSNTPSDPQSSRSDAIVYKALYGQDYWKPGMRLVRVGF